MANEDTFHLGIKALIRNQQGQVLVLKANIKDFKRGTAVVEHWDLPGGRVQKGENINQTLVREIKEEIGVKNLRVIKLLDASVSKMRLFCTDAGLILFTYLCSLDSDTKIKLCDNEHVEFKWLNPKEAAELLKIKFSDSLVHTLEKL